MTLDVRKKKESSYQYSRAGRLAYRCSAAKRSAGLVAAPWGSHFAGYLARFPRYRNRQAYPTVLFAREQEPVASGFSGACTTT
jgi:hypothetical protein